MFIYNVRYVFADNRDTFWNANIAAEKNNSQEVLDYLYRKLKKPIIVDTISFITEVHSLTDELRTKLVSIFAPEPLHEEKESSEPKPEKVIKRRHRRSNAEVAAEKARIAEEKAQRAAEREKKRAEKLNFKFSE